MIVLFRYVTLRVVTVETVRCVRVISLSCVFKEKITTLNTPTGTAPNVCTCEKGWRGERCEEAICAQECVHGYCVAPDQCECDRWPNEFKDSQGKPLYRLPSGEPQLTGWTGFDCNTPICVQAEEFRSNTPEGEYVLEEEVRTCTEIIRRTI